jgi:hypothetical protein
MGAGNLNLDRLDDASKERLEEQYVELATATWRSVDVVITIPKLECPAVKPVFDSRSIV